MGLLGVAATSRSMWVSLLVLGAAVGCALLAARVPLRTYAVAVLAPASFVVLGAIPIALTFGGSPTGVLAQLGPVAVTADGR